jgi:1-acyl-sn-glycerol-3-phosphate acyltransferase
MTNLTGLQTGNAWASFFPEGQLNSTPSEIMPFRYGGMKTALAVDARLFQLVTSGCPDVWPKTAGPFVPPLPRHAITPLPSSPPPCHYLPTAAYDRRERSSFRDP